MGFLDGELAELIGTALPDAGLSIPAVLTKLRPTQRDPSRVTAATEPTRTDYAADGFVASLTRYRVAGTLIANVTRVVKLYASTIASGQTPAPGDQITIAGVTSTIVNDDGDKRAVTTDAATAVWTCQCR